MYIKNFKKLFFLLILLFVFGCSTNKTALVETSETATSVEETVLETEAKKEVKKVVWAQGTSGNVLVSIAKKNGYFDEVGVEVEEIPLDEGQIQAVTTGRVDIASNTGTWEPLRSIISGNDLSIIGGNMLTGCMPVIAKKGTVWNSPKDFIGKKVADDKSCYALYHTLAEEGYDLDKDIDWRQYGDDSDEIQAVIKGEVDFATIGTNKMYELQNTSDIDIVTFCSDVTPNYSCCRMIARDSWVKENKETIKLINMALIKSLSYFENHREDCVDLMAKQLNAPEDYVKAYLLNEHYRINPDTVKNTIIDNYNYIMEVKGVENPDPSVKIEEHIYNDIYKEALDEAQKRWGSENPSFYERAQQFYRENNE